MSAADSAVNLEYILPPIAAACIALYMGTYFVVLWHHPLRLNLGMKMAVRRRWAAHVVEDNQAIVAVQTLRNSQNAAAVFASAAVLVAFFAFQQGSTLVAAQSTLQGVKFYVLGATLVCAFFVFGISIREAEAVGYLCYAKNSPREWDSIEVPLVPRVSDSAPALRREMTIANSATRKALAAAAAAQSALFWALGLRFFYLAICIGGWIASPIACLCVTLVMLLCVFALDRNMVRHMVRP